MKFIRDFKMHHISHQKMISPLLKVRLPHPYLIKKKKRAEAIKLR